MQEAFNKVLHNAVALFSKYGIRNVTMDDIAHELGMSKKTLYQYVENKADLVQKVLEFKLTSENLFIEQIQAKQQNAIDEMVEIANYVHQQLANIKPAILYELRKYYPEIWQVFEQHRQTRVANCLTQNIEKGMKEGLYRIDIKPDILTRLYLAQAECLISDIFFVQKNYTLPDVYAELFRYHLNGIVTDEGRAYLAKRK